jgi:hypothetical protein
VENRLNRYNPFEYFKIWPTNHQAFNTTIFILLGKFALNITITWQEILVALVVSFIVEYFVSRLKGEPRPLKYCGSAVVAALSVCVLLRSSYFYVLPLSLIVGLVQKYYVRWNKQHFLNPSNVAVVFALIFFTNRTYLDFQTWGGKYTSISIVIICAVLLLTRLKLLRVSALLFFLFFLLNFIFITDNPLVIFNKLTKTTFLLYSFFIINDPMTLPKRSSYRLLQVVIIAFSAFFLELYWGSKEITLPLSLLIVSFLNPFWRIREEKNEHPKVEWFVLIPIILITGALFYFSDFNFKRNFSKSKQVQSLELQDKNNEKMSEPAKPLSELEWNNLWSHDNSFFLKSWDKKQTYSVALTRKNQAHDGFISVQNEITNYFPPRKVEFSGEDLSYYAPITAGDINHDGLLDVVLGSPFGELKVFVNRGNYQFSDVTSLMFDQIPKNIQATALVDLNNDGYLDLVVIRDNYIIPQNDLIYLFNKESKKFKLFYEIPKTHGKSVGGLAFTDINHDNFLDIYIGYGLNWHDFDPKFRKTSASPDMFLVSGNNTYQNKLDTYFKLPAKTSFATMSTVFSDLNQNGEPALLIGNDFNDPSLIFIQNKGKFSLIDKNLIENNTLYSMSYFPVDLDSDGVFEIWENGLADELPSLEKNKALYQEHSKSLAPTPESVDFLYLAGRQFYKKYDCENVKTTELKKLCQILFLKYQAIETNNKDICNQIKPISFRATCVREYEDKVNKSSSSYGGGRFDPEKYPKQLETNVILKKTKSGVYENIAPENLLYLGWGWAAYPFDINNDGLIDMYLTTGFGSYSHNTNKLLLNTTKNHVISFEEMAGAYKVDFEEESRGVIISDFTNSGVGDLVVNNFGSHPIYMANNLPGDSIEFELRSKTNYYGLGAKIYLTSNLHKQVREVTTGGTWNSFMPSRVHFGIAPKETIEEITIEWPNGEKEIRKDLTRNNLYFIYQ